MTVLLAFNGDLNSSALIQWLAETRQADVVALTLDTGQGRLPEDVRERALAIGAVRAHLIDIRDEYARDFLLPAIRTDAPAARTSIGWAVLAKHLVQVAAFEAADAVAHGGHGFDLDAAILASRPDLELIAPARSWDLSPADVAEYARARGIPIPDAGLDLAARSGAGVSNEPAWVDLAFERGVPMSINGVSMPLVDLIQSLETISRDHGVEGAIGGLGTAYRELLLQGEPVAAGDPSLVTGTVRLRLHEGVCLVDGEAEKNSSRGALDEVASADQSVR
jgi:argininosuccinate synthase